MSRLTIRVPADFELARDACSYGYFLLAPNHWDPSSGRLVRTFTLPGGAVTASISQPAVGAGLRVRCDTSVARAAQVEIRRQITRMLRLDESEADLRAFHRIDPRWRRSGRGRLFRSPTLFEDVVKTVTSCNVAWPSTINMNARLCEVLGPRSCSGGSGFPDARRLSRVRPGTLRGRCRVGYRDQRMIDLAKLFVRGEIDASWLESPATSDDEVFAFLLSLPGIGPYAAGNIMQLLGRYSRLALDTESVRHGKASLGLRGSDRAILKALTAYYEPFGAHRFRAYWLELWSDYEAKRGPARLWERETTGRTFTAALLRD